ncbi:N alpha-acetyl-transferase [Microsporum ferrugineum]
MPIEMLAKKRKRDLEESEASSPSQPKAKENISLIESVNSLPISEFIHRYVPSYALNLTIQLAVNSSDDTPEESKRRAYSLQFYTAASMPEAYMDACYNLIYLTSSAAYKQSTSGWSSRKKRQEMKLLDMRYMVLVAENEHAPEGKSEMPPIGGFLSFMVTDEDGIPVLYCYEIHLAPEVQHKGVGKQLLRIFEDIGRNVGLQKGMLTVFKSNRSATRFYERIGFMEDASSPKPTKLRNGRMREFDYMIMSLSFTSSDGDCMDTTDHDLS